jgi:ferredoxin
MSSNDPNPSQAPTGALPEEVVVHLRDGRIERVKYHAGDTLLETMRRGGIDAPYACERGECGTCMVLRLKGEVELRENRVLSREDLADGYTLACQGEPRGDVCEIQLEG